MADRRTPRGTRDLGLLRGDKLHVPGLSSQGDVNSSSEQTLLLQRLLANKRQGQTLNPGLPAERPPDASGQPRSKRTAVSHAGKCWQECQGQTEAEPHQDPMPAELVRTDTAGPPRLPETHVPSAANSAMYGQARGTQPGTQQLPLLHLGQLHSGARLGRGAADHRFSLPPETAGEEEEQNGPGAVGPQVPPASRGSPPPAAEGQHQQPGSDSILGWGMVGNRLKVTQLP